MSSIGTTLLNSLRSVERPGDFCVGGIREIFMPTIDVDGGDRGVGPERGHDRIALGWIVEPQPRRADHR